MAKQSPDLDALLPLTPLSFHILLALADGVRHGYGIIKEIERRTDGRMKPATGTMYLAMQRLEDGEFVTESDERPDAQEDDERRRYYCLTPLGKEVAAAEAKRLLDLVGIAKQKRLLSGKDLAAVVDRKE